MSFGNPEKISRNPQQPGPSGPTVADWLATSTAAKRKLRGELGSADEDENVISEFHEPQNKWRREELDETQGAGTNGKPTTSQVQTMDVSVQTSDDHLSHGEMPTTSGKNVGNALVQSSDDVVAHEEFDALIRDGQFREAIALLEAQPKTQLQQMKLLECYSRIRDHERASEVIESMKISMAQTNRRKADDVFELAEKNRKNSSVIKALTFYACAGKLYLFESDPNDRVRGIKKCYDGCDLSLKATRGGDEASLSFAHKVAITILNKFFDDVNDVKADTYIKTVTLVDCLHRAGSYHALLRNYQEAKEHCERAINVVRSMSCRLGPNASKLDSFGNLLRLMGILNQRLGKYSEAKTCYIDAIKAYEDAENISSYRKRVLIGSIKSQMSKIDESLLPATAFHAYSELNETQKSEGGVPFAKRIATDVSLQIM